MLRRLLNLLTALSLLLCVAAALWAWDWWFPSPRGMSRPSTAAVQSALARPAPGFTFTGGRFEHLVGLARGYTRNWLSDVPIVVDWPALRATGVERSTPVEFAHTTGHVGDMLARIAAAHGLLLTSRGDVLLLTTSSAVEAGAVVAAPDPQPARPPLTTEFVAGENRWTLAVDEGALRAWRTAADPAAAFRPSAAAHRKSTAAWEADYRGGISIAREGYPRESFRLRVDFRTIAVACAVLPILRVAAAAVRRTRRRAPGLCVSCGYDLRATPGRCPECGRGRETSTARAGPGAVSSPG